MADRAPRHGGLAPPARRAAPGHTSNALEVVAGSVVRLLGTLRAYAAFSSDARFTQEVPLRSESPLLRGFKALYARLNAEASEDIDAVSLVRPFLAIVGCPDVEGTITGAALGALNKFLLYGVLAPGTARLGEAVNRIAAAVTACSFVPVSKADDEATLIALLEVLQNTVRAEAGALLSDESLWAVLQCCYAVSRTMVDKASHHLLRRSAEAAVSSILLHVFSRVGELAAAQSNSSHSSSSNYSSALVVVAEGVDHSQPSLPAPAPYGEPVVTSIVSWLSSLIEPGKNDRHTRLWGLELINMALETGGPALGSLPGVVTVVQAELCRSMIPCSRSADPALLSLALRVVYGLFSTLRAHLKVQLEVFLTSIHLFLAEEPAAGSGGASGSGKGSGSSSGGAASSSVTPAQREMAVESLVEFSRDPTMMLDLYINYDCDVACSNLYEAVVKCLCKCSLPPQAPQGRSTAAPQHAGSQHASLPGNGDAVSEPGDGDEAASASRRVEAGHRALRAALVPASTPPETGRVLTTLHVTAMEGVLAILSTMASRVAGLPPRALAQDSPSPHDWTASSSSASATSPAASANPGLLLKQRKQLKQKLALAAVRFNSDPKGWLDYVSKGLGLLPVPPDPVSVARFLRECPGLDKAEVGLYISEPDDEKHAFNTAVRQAFVESFDLSGLSLEGALRLFLESFRLPGEAQKIERLIQAFAARVWTQAPGPMTHPDTPFILGYSIIMLNTDLHNKQVKKKMTREQFISNNRGIDGGRDLPPAFLSAIYDSIAAKEIMMRADVPAAGAAGGAEGGAAAGGSGGGGGGGEGGGGSRGGAGGSSRRDGRDDGEEADTGAAVAAAVGSHWDGVLRRQLTVSAYASSTGSGEGSSGTGNGGGGSGAAGGRATAAAAAAALAEGSGSTTAVSSSSSSSSPAPHAPDVSLALLHQRDMLSLLAGPALDALTVVFNSTTDPVVLKQVSTGFRDLAALAAVHGLEDTLNLALARLARCAVRDTRLLLEVPDDQDKQLLMYARAIIKGYAAGRRAGGGGGAAADGAGKAVTQHPPQQHGAHGRRRRGSSGMPLPGASEVHRSSRLPAHSTAAESGTDTTAAGGVFSSHGGGGGGASARERALPAAGAGAFASPRRRGPVSRAKGRRSSAVLLREVLATPLKTSGSGAPGGSHGDEDDEDEEDEDAALAKDWEDDEGDGAEGGNGGSGSADAGSDATSSSSSSSSDASDSEDTSEEERLAIADVIREDGDEGGGGRGHARGRGTSASHKRGGGSRSRHASGDSSNAPAEPHWQATRRHTTAADARARSQSFDAHLFTGGASGTGAGGSGEGAEPHPQRSPGTGGSTADAAHAPHKPGAAMSALALVTPRFGAHRRRRPRGSGAGATGAAAIGPVMPAAFLFRRLILAVRHVLLIASEHTSALRAAGWRALLELLSQLASVDAFPEGVLSWREEGAVNGNGRLPALPSVAAAGQPLTGALLRPASAAAAVPPLSASSSPSALLAALQAHASLIPGMLRGSGRLAAVPALVALWASQEGGGGGAAGGAAEDSPRPGTPAFDDVTPLPGVKGDASESAVVVAAPKASPASASLWSSLAGIFGGSAGGASSRRGGSTGASEPPLPLDGLPLVLTALAAEVSRGSHVPAVFAAAAAAGSATSAPAAAALLATLTSASSQASASHRGPLTELAGALGADPLAMFTEGVPLGLWERLAQAAGTLSAEEVRTVLRGRLETSCVLRSPPGILVEIPWVPRPEDATTGAAEADTVASKASAPSEAASASPHASAPRTPADVLERASDALASLLRHELLTDVLLAGGPEALAQDAAAFAPALASLQHALTTAAAALNPVVPAHPPATVSDDAAVSPGLVTCLDIPGTAAKLTAAAEAGVGDEGALAAVLRGFTPGAAARGDEAPEESFEAVLRRELGDDDEEGEGSGRGHAAAPPAATSAGASRASPPLEAAVFAGDPRAPPEAGLHREAPSDPGAALLLERASAGLLRLLSNCLDALPLAAPAAAPGLLKLATDALMSLTSLPPPAFAVAAPSLSRVLARALAASTALPQLRSPAAAAVPPAVLAAAAVSSLTHAIPLLSAVFAAMQRCSSVFLAGPGVWEALTAAASLDPVLRARAAVSAATGGGAADVAVETPLLQLQKVCVSGTLATLRAFLLPSAGAPTVCGLAAALLLPTTLEEAGALVHSSAGGAASSPPGSPRGAGTGFHPRRRGGSAGPAPASMPPTPVRLAAVKAVSSDTLSSLLALAQQRQADAEAAVAALVAHLHADARAAMLAALDGDSLASHREFSTAAALRLLEQLAIATSTMPVNGALGAAVVDDTWTSVLAALGAVLADWARALKSGVRGLRVPLRLGLSLLLRLLVAAGPASHPGAASSSSSAPPLLGAATWTTVFRLVLLPLHGALADAVLARVVPALAADAEASAEAEAVPPAFFPMALEEAEGVMAVTSLLLRTWAHAADAFFGARAHPSAASEAAALWCDVWSALLTQLEIVRAWPLPADARASETADALTVVIEGTVNQLHHAALHLAGRLASGRSGGGPHSDATAQTLRFLADWALRQLAVAHPRAAATLVASCGDEAATVFSEDTIASVASAVAAGEARPVEAGEGSGSEAEGPAALAAPAPLPSLTPVPGSVQPLLSTEDAVEAAVERVLGVRTAAEASESQEEAAFVPLMEEAHTDELAATGGGEAQADEEEAAETTSAAAETGTETAAASGPTTAPASTQPRGRLASLGWGVLRLFMGDLEDGAPDATVTPRQVLEALDSDNEGTASSSAGAEAAAQPDSDDSEAGEDGAGAEEAAMADEATMEASAADAASDSFAALAFSEALEA